VRIVHSRGAIADIDRLREFLAAKSPVAARDAIAAIDGGMQSLMIFPLRGRPVGIQALRELIIPTGRSAYVVRYSYSASRDEVVILRIWHGREERA
jgi:plasmid stabilization system protein ParE